MNLLQTIRTYTSLRTLSILAALLIIVPAFLRLAPSIFTQQISVHSLARKIDAFTPLFLKIPAKVVQKISLTAKEPEWTYFIPDNFTYRTERHVAGSVTYMARVPVTGIEKADESVSGSVRAFLTSLPVGDAKKAGETMEFNSEVRAFDTFLSVTLSSAESSAFTTMLVDKNGAVAQEAVSGGEKQMTEEYIVDYATTTLTQRFPGAQREDMSRAVSEAYAKKSYRVASNGIVIIIPKEKLKGAGVTAPFHEVLVPHVK